MKLEKLGTLVANQYNAHHEGRDEWADWLYQNHVLWVAHKTNEFCKRFNGDGSIAVSAALLHDIADSVMQREQAGHEQKSLEIGRTLALEAGYSVEETAIIIDDICAKHSCRDGIIPESNEGKLMAAADACAHFQTEFYLFAFNQGSNFGDYDYLKNWARKKIEKDFSKKIFHAEIRAEVRPDYETWQRVFNY